MRKTFEFGEDSKVVINYDDGDSAGVATIEHVYSKVSAILKVIIPAEINGCKVGAIGRRAFSSLSCKKLFLPKGIMLAPEAFRNADIAEVHIPGVREIPYGCFRNSSLKRLLDCDSVERVGSGAFADTDQLAPFEWFPKATQIPTECFCRSGITSISNARVSEISVNAFAYSAIEEIEITADCRFREGCFCCTPISKIVFTANEDVHFATEMFKNCRNRVRLVGCRNVALQTDMDPDNRDDIFDIESRNGSIIKI